MQALNNLYTFAEARGIRVHFISLYQKKGCCVKVDDQYAVALNKNISTIAEEKEVLAEELGHCESDTLYYLEDYANPLFRLNIEQAERRAADWALMRLVPLQELKEQLWCEDNIVFVAEYFNVSKETVYQAVDCYKRKNLL